jgi:hypothetical protein
MGVFDYITFEGGVPGCPVQRFQTKDLDAQWLDEYFVTADGRLEHEAYEIQEVPKAERDFPDAPEDSFLSMCGSIRRVNIRRVPEPYTGCVLFYGDGFDGLRSIGLQGQGNEEFDPGTGTMAPARVRTFYRFTAEFKDGVLVGPPELIEVDRD